MHARVTAGTQRNLTEVIFIFQKQNKQHQVPPKPCQSIDYTKQLPAELYHRHITPIMWKLDTVAEMNVISKHNYEEVVADPWERQSGPPQCKITTNEGHNIKNLLLKGARIIVPPAHRKEIFTIIHQGNLGERKVPAES